MTAERLVIDVARLDREGEDFEGEIDPAVIDYSLTDADFAKTVGGLRYRLFVQLLGSELLVRGAISQDFERVCSRCAIEFNEHIAVPSFVASMEVSDSDSFVDLTDELREAILLDFPGYPVCRPDCRGLCPHCGADLNLGPCGCKDSDTPDACWGGLDKLNLQ